MFDIVRDTENTVRLSGRLDASQVEKADSVLDTVEASVTVDFSDLEYISSAGLGVLLKAQQRLGESGEALTLAGMNKHIRLVFQYAGFEHVFTIE